MITSKSRKREIKDLQRLLVAVGLMPSSDGSESGKWGLETQAAVLLAYSRLGWEHPPDGRWITSPALAAIASAMRQHTVEASETPTSSGHIGGSGSHIGGSGSHIGGSGSHIGADSNPD